MSRRLLDQLRRKLFKVEPPSRARNAFIDTLEPPVGQKMRDYYFPDIDVKRMADQDPEIKALNLEDQWVKVQLEREEGLKRRGKIVRVGVLTGRRKKPEGEESGKKKKRK
ncbi:hypothetical protein HK101_001856 [Irineochytrium annulatum]|nr:hypothetical protein HK101_001856 [Irineochytrium annulatum]